MIEFFRIQNFGCFKDLGLEGFSRINFFVGKANTGKTVLLEALSLFFGIDTLSRYVLMPLEYLFYECDVSRNIILSGGKQGKVEKEVVIFKRGSDTLILTNENGYKKLANLLIKPRIYWLTENFIQENRELLLKLFQLLDSDITSFTKISSVYHLCFSDGRCIPLSLCGDSFIKVIELFYQLKTYKVAIVDGIEAYFHYSIFSELWKFLEENFSDYQLFATTYSYEFIASAPSYTSLYRLEKPHQVIHCPSDILQSAIAIGIELR